MMPSALYLGNVHWNGIRIYGYYWPFLKVEINKYLISHFTNYGFVIFIYICIY